MIIDFPYKKFLKITLIKQYCSKELVYNNRTTKWN